MIAEGVTHVGCVHGGPLAPRRGVDMNNRTTAAPTSGTDMDRYAWLAPERMIVGLLCFLTFVCACIAGLLLAAA